MVKKITKMKIIEKYLNEYNRRYYLRELAESLDKPHQSIKPYLKELVKEKVLIETIRKNIVEYSLNLKDNKTYDYLVIAEKEMLLERLNTDTYLKLLFERVSIYFTQDTFIIFGSSVSKIKEGSDIDLIIIGKDDIKKTLKEYEDIYNKKIHTVQVKDINTLTEGIVKEVYKKHLILNNTETIIRFFDELNEKNKLV